MTHLVNALLQLPPPLIHQWGYFIIYGGAFFEALPLFGTIVPGHLLVIAGGFLARENVLGLYDTMIGASIAAIAGDFAGYWIGRYRGRSFITRWGKYFFFKPEYLEKTKKLVHEHPGKTLIIGRFNAVSRAFAPFAAGASELPFRKFIPYNIAGGIAWAVSSVLLGYIFGASYEVAAKYFGEIFLIALIGGVLLGWGYYWLNQKKHLFKKYHGYVIAFNILSLYLLAKMITDVMERETITRWDVFVNQKIAWLWNPALNRVMLAATHLISPLGLVVLSLLLLIILILTKKWYNTILLAVGLGGGILFQATIKYLLRRPRPPLHLLALRGFSFPSAHATLATIFFALLMYSFKDDIKIAWLRRLFIAVNIIIFILIGFTRIYLGTHWVSDVLAGYALGIFWLTLLILIFRLILAFFRRRQTV